MNQFKQVNDNYGHAVGDQLLQRISKIFEERLRHIDTVARTGGDEFSIILECPVTRADAEKVARALLEEMREPLKLSNRSVQASFSFGIAMYPEDAKDAETLYITADTRMYETKAASAVGI
jgi:diguanylate cyclase (GGDEF)-like protein